jgi:hypothetical protein
MLLRWLDTTALGMTMLAGLRSQEHTKIIWFHEDLEDHVFQNEADLPATSRSVDAVVLLVAPHVAVTLGKFFHYNSNIQYFNEGE